MPLEFNTLVYDPAMPLQFNTLVDDPAMPLQFNTLVDDPAMPLQFNTLSYTLTTQQNHLHHDMDSLFSRPILNKRIKRENKYFLKTNSLCYAFERQCDQDNNNGHYFLHWHLKSKRNDHSYGFTAIISFCQTALK
jgi:hypothetical protein